MSIQFEDTENPIYENYVNLTITDPSKCILATSDAEQYHGKKGGHFALGVLFGPFAMIGTALANPSPLKGKQTLALSSNSALFNDPEYLMCYKKKAKAQLIGMEALGWAAWILLVIAL